MAKYCIVMVVSPRRAPGSAAARVPLAEPARVWPIEDRGAFAPLHDDEIV
jgi:hypothetical protein